MKLYTDNQHRVVDIGSTTKPGLTELEVPDWTFGDITEAQIKCYSCILDAHGNPMIQLLVPPGVFDQVGVLDRQRAADQEEVTALTESAVDNDYRLSTLELGL